MSHQIIKKYQWDTEILKAYFYDKEKDLDFFQQNMDQKVETNLIKL